MAVAFRGGEARVASDYLHVAQTDSRSVRHPGQRRVAEQVRVQLFNLVAPFNPVRDRSYGIRA
jgi:hypothetical protein